MKKQIIIILIAAVSLFFSIIGGIFIGVSLSKDEEVVASSMSPPTRMKGSVLVKNGAELCRAAAEGDLEKVSYLLDEGVNVNSVESKFTYMGKTLEYSARTSEELGYSSEKTTPLLEAVESSQGSVKIVELLIDEGANVNEPDEDGKTALMVAAGKSHSKLVEILLEADADVNAKIEKGFNKGKTALIYAADAFSPSERVVKLLIDAGAKVNVADNSGNTALMEAAVGGHAEIVKMLIDAGADVNAKDEGWVFDGTVLIKTVDSFSPSKEVVRLLLNAGAKIDERNDSGETALIVAAKSGEPEIVRMLIKAGANVNARDEDGRSALDVSDYSCRSILRQAGAR